MYQEFSKVFSNGSLWLHNQTAYLSNAPMQPDLLLLIKETQAMEEYIKQVPKQGYIGPSMSPPSVWFFFVEKKALSYCMCWLQRIKSTHG